MKKSVVTALTAVVVSCALTGCVGTPVIYNSCNCNNNSAGTTAVTEAAPESQTAEDITENSGAGAETETVSEAPATEAMSESTETEAADGQETESQSAGESQESESQTDGAEISDTALKTGLSVTVSLADSIAADAENEGAAKYDITMVAVSVDESGVIQSCIIDSVPATVAFDKTGVITSDLSAEVLTKNELGEDYGMKLYGGAAYEWNEQAAALADYAEGKTVEELKNGAIDESGKAKDADLASTATIYLGGYVAAIEDAVNQAQYRGAQKGDELRMASISGIGSSVGVDGETDGTAQLDTDITVLTLQDDVITSCYIDSVQAKVNFNAEGAITSDLTAPVQTKNQLGENYGMKLYAQSAYEWNEQAAAFAEYVTGKTVEEMKGIAVDEKTAPTEADLASTVTIAVGGFQAVIEKAAN